MLPVCDTFLFSAVANCIQLEELILPMQRSMYKAGYERLFGCTGLKKVVMPVLYEMDEFLNNMFADCIAIEEVDIHTMKFRLERPDHARERSGCRMRSLLLR